MKHNPRLLTSTLAACLLLVGNLQAAVLILPGTATGDAGYAWNSKYGPYGYTTGGTTLGVGLYMGAPYGNDYTMGIVEIRIADLVGGDLSSAILNVYSEGFNTGYFYGSAGMRWLDVGSIVVTGDPVADALGPILGGPANEYGLWDSYVGQGAGWFSFDVTAHVLADLAAGRNYSTFVVNGSRDTSGGIRTAEYGSGFGPNITATSTVPEPGVTLTFAISLAALVLRRRRAEPDGINCPTTAS
jgi:hypothetical protein